MSVCPTLKIAPTVGIGLAKGIHYALKWVKKGKFPVVHEFSSDMFSDVDAAEKEGHLYAYIKTTTDSDTNTLWQSIPIKMEQHDWQTVYPRAWSGIWSHSAVLIWHDGACVSTCRPISSALSAQGCLRHAANTHNVWFQIVLVCRPVCIEPTTCRHSRDLHCSDF